MTEIDRLDELARATRSLSPPIDERVARSARTLEYLEDYLTRHDDGAAYYADTANTPAGLLRPSEHGIGIDRAFGLLRDHVDASGIDNQSARFFAYVPGGAIHEAALADFIAAVTNRYAGAGFAAPGVARLENDVIAWLADIMGYPDCAAGDLTSGGSIAALSAVVTARHASGLAARDVDSSVVYLTRHTHHCLQKALSIAGLGECVFRYVDCDSHYRMSANALEAAIASDRRQSLRPWLILGSAGTTDTGSVDPLDALADIAERERLWFHVDAAYGGAFMLCDEGRARLTGIERSDSLMFDPHKGFFLPFGSGVVLVRDGDKLKAAFRARGAYMRDLDSGHGASVRSACDYSPELTRPFRGLRLWLPFQVHGIAPFRAAVEEKLVLARYLHRRLGEIRGIDVGPEPRPVSRRVPGCRPGR